MGKNKKNKKNKVLKIMILFLLASFVVLIFLAGFKRILNNTIKIGMVSDFKTTAKSGAEIAILEVNNKGGLLVGGRKHKVELIQKDNRGNMENNDLLALDLAKEKVSGIVVLGTRLSLGTVESLKEKGIFFSGFFTEDLYNEGSYLSNFALNSLKTKNAAVIFNKDNPLFEKQAESFKKAYESLGGNIVFENAITDKTSEFVSIILKLKDSGAEVVFAPLKLNDISNYVQLSHYFSYKVPFLGTEGWTEGNLLSVCGMECNGSYFLSYFYPNTERKNFIENYKNFYITSPTEDLLIGYETTNNLLSLIQSGDKTEGKLPHNIIKIEEEKGKIVE